MKLLERILVATAFGPGSDDAVKTALLLAKTFRSHVLLLHVMESIPASPVVTERMRQSAARQLQGIADRFKAEGNGDVEAVVMWGNRCDSIVACADHHDVNVIVIGSGDNADTAHFRLGSTAAEVRRKATKPVWVVKQGESPQINRIVCPVDSSDLSRRALRNAVHLSRNLGAELTVLTVIRPLSSLFLGLGAPSEETQQTHVETQQGQFERLLTDFDFYDVRWNRVTRRGEPHQEILAAAAEVGADLIVMGSEARTGIVRMVMGSVAENVAGKMPCSIITVKSEQVIRLRLDEATSDTKALCSEGQALLDKGFPAEARRQFEQVVARDRMCTPAWDGLAAVYRRLGDEKQAAKCADTVKEIVRTISETQATAEARGRHALPGRRRWRL